MEWKESDRPALYVDDYKNILYMIGLVEKTRKKTDPGIQIILLIEKVIQILKI